MENGVEIYLRPLGDGGILNIYVPPRLADAFFEALKAGRFSDPSVPVAFEMSVLPQWYSNKDDDHVRVPVSSVNVMVEG